MLYYQLGLASVTNILTILHLQMNEIRFGKEFMDLERSYFDWLKVERNTIIQLFRVSVMKTLSCREAGFDCDYVVKGETEEEIFKNGAEHATKDHGMKPEDITPQFKEKLRGLIRNS